MKREDSPPIRMNWGVKFAISRFYIYKIKISHFHTCKIKKIKNPKSFHSPDSNSSFSIAK